MSWYRGAWQAILAAYVLTHCLVSYANGDYTAADSSALTNFDLNALQKLIDENATRSIEDLLPILPKTCLEQYVLAYKTGSKQFASTTSPRAILSCQNGRLILTFSGAPGKPGYNQLEVLSFDPQAKKLIPAEIEFAADKQRKPTTTINPQSCIECHGREARHIWTDYPAWPGMFQGSHPYNPNDKSIESASHIEFLTRAPSDPRYKHLIPQFIHDTKSKLWTGNPVSPSGNPNMMLSYYLQKINEQRFSERIFKNPRFREFKYAVAALGRGCFEPDAFFPKAIQKLGLSFEKTRQEIATQRQATRDQIADQYRIENPSFVKVLERFDFRASVDDLTVVRYVLDRMGLDFYEFFTTPHRGLLVTPFGDDLVLMIKELLKTDPRLADLDLQHKSCEQLAEMSHKALMNLKINAQNVQCDVTYSILDASARSCIESSVKIRTALDAKRASMPAALFTCSECHSTIQAPKAGAPAIPFGMPNEFESAISDDPKLEEKIRARITSKKADKMPPNRSLTEGEIRSIINYIGALQGQ